MNTQQNLDAIKRLLERKQAIPSQMIRELMIDCKAQMALNNALKKHIADLEAKPVTEKAEA
jgi:hypothetical protein